MARPTASDPLIPLPVRLPESTVMRLRAQAEEAGRSVSDLLRAHLTLTEAKPLGKPRPQKRAAHKLAEVSGADPAFLRQLASIGNNLNQLARAVNGGAVSGTPMDGVQILATLRAIEQQVTALGRGRAR